MANPNEANPISESAKAEVAKLDLPSVESPSISPAGPLTEPTGEPVIAAAPAAEPASGIAPAAWPSADSLKPRQKRNALLAASVAIAGAIGAIVGAAASGGFTTPAPQVAVATIEDSKALEQQISRLAKEVTVLKTSLDATSKTASAQTAQIAKINERADRIERSVTAELVTGSISAPQTVPVAQAAAPTTTPLPTPRPAPRVAAPAVAQPFRPQIIQDWAIREARDGMIYVQGHGDTYQIVPGAPLPGLGNVQSVKRIDGRWVVQTPKGIIVSMRDRRFFE
jgi:hypothetical protein